MEKTSLMKLIPRDTILNFHGKQYKINKYSLFYELQIVDKYGEDKLKEVLEKGSLYEKLRVITDIIYMLIDDKTDFVDYESFMKFIAGIDDKIAVLTAGNIAMGATMPAITPDESKELADEKKNESKPKAWMFWKRIFRSNTGGR